MKVSRFVFFALIVQSLAWKGMPSVQDSPVLNPNNFFYNSFSKGGNERKESFRFFYLKQIKKMERILEGVLSYLESTLQNEKIPLQINEGELTDDLASFVHGLRTEQDFDAKGFLTPESLEQVRSSGLKNAKNVLRIDLMCRGHVQALPWNLKKRVCDFVAVFQIN